MLKKIVIAMEFIFPNRMTQLKYMGDIAKREDLDNVTDTRNPKWKSSREKRENV